MGPLKSSCENKGMHGRLPSITSKFRIITLLIVAWLPLAALAGDRPLFCSLRGEAGLAGSIMGTVHSEDPRVLEYTPEFLALLAGSDIFAMELVPDLPTLEKLSRFMHLPQEQDLPGLIGEQRFAAVTRALSSYGLEAEQIARMKPWAVMMTLSVPPPQTGLFMDFSLSLRASGNGLRIVGLESLEEQLAFLENMSEEQQMRLLDHAVEEFAEAAAVHRELVDSYLRGDPELLWQMAAEQMEALDPDTRVYFESEGIDARNHRMMESLLAFMEEGTVFVAVGALHLPGEVGLLALLRKQGYTLEPLPMPFTATP